MATRLDHLEASQRAEAGLAALDGAHTRLLDVVARMDDRAVRGRSLLPGWTRGHVITHLARNADAMVNLLTWARTGIEHPMYASRADRDADIHEGASRRWRVLDEDLMAACDRFTVAARRLSPTQWTAELSNANGTPMFAHEIPWLRLREVWVHLIDLDFDVDFTAVPASDLEELLDDAVRGYHGRADVPPLRLEIDLADGRQRIWELNLGNGSCSVVRGSAPCAVAWLTGRCDGMGLSGELPALPNWI